MVQLAGNEHSLMARADAAFASGDYQWSLELSSAVFKTNSSNKRALDTRTEALKALADSMGSPNARNYYLTSALEDNGEIALSPNPIQKFVPVISLDKLLRSLAVWVDGERCGEKNIKLYFNVTDTNQVFLAHLRNGILEAKTSSRPPMTFDALVILRSELFQEVLGQKLNPIVLQNHPEVDIVGQRASVASFFNCFDISAWKMN